ncbi:unnamed protein product [Amoebophrya sp. A120]|nr:unnamed protein product [Amoebophrya sp. A120]|eukprot:GSA120T00007925001.1
MGVSPKANKEQILAGNIKQGAQQHPKSEFKNKKAAYEIMDDAYDNGCLVNVPDDEDLAVHAKSSSTTQKTTGNRKKSGSSGRNGTASAPPDPAQQQQHESSMAQNSRAMLENLKREQREMNAAPSRGRDRGGRNSVFDGSSRGAGDGRQLNVHQSGTSGGVPAPPVERVPSSISGVTPVLAGGEIISNGKTSSHSKKPRTKKPYADYQQEMQNTVQKPTGGFTKPSEQGRNSGNSRANSSSSSFRAASLEVLADDSTNLRSPGASIKKPPKKGRK